MKKQDPSATRVSPFLRALALLLDLGLFAGLAVSLVSGIDYLTYSFLGSSGAQFNATLMSFPILLLYMLYFSSMNIKNHCQNWLTQIIMSRGKFLICRSDKIFHSVVVTFKASLIR